jgi:hypothetical protein
MRIYAIKYTKPTGEHGYIGRGTVYGRPVTLEKPEFWSDAARANSVALEYGAKVEEWEAGPQ